MKKNVAVKDNHFYEAYTYQISITALFIYLILIKNDLNKLEIYEKGNPVQLYNSQFEKVYF